MIDVGEGDVIVLIPGIQGHWQWMTPAVESLSRTHRVLSFSLQEIDSTSEVTSEVGFFTRGVAYLDALLDRAGVARAIVVGVSFGGVVASHYAAERPSRVSRLVLVSAPSPRWRPDERVARHLRHPRLAVPAFVAGAVGRLVPEIRAAFDSWPARARFAIRHGLRALRWPIRPARMAAWVRAWHAADLAAGLARITAPTLVIVGDAALDQVVPVASTREYLQLIPGARLRTLARTGHLGCISRPDEFAAIVTATEM